MPCLPEGHRRTDHCMGDNGKRNGYIGQDRRIPRKFCHRAVCPDSVLRKGVERRSLPLGFLHPVWTVIRTWWKRYFGLDKEPCHPVLQNHRWFRYVRDRRLFVVRSLLVMVIPFQYPVQRCRMLFGFAVVRRVGRIRRKKSCRKRQSSISQPWWKGTRFWKSIDRVHR